MQVLANEELDVIFEVMTQRNQYTLEEIFSTANKETASKESVPTENEESKEKPAKGKTEQKEKQPVSAKGEKPAVQQGGTSASASGAGKAVSPKPKQNKPFTPRQIAEKRVVDTRGGSAVNIDKYNEKYETLGDNKGFAPPIYHKFLEKYLLDEIVYLELGVGGNTPGIIKYPFWRFTVANPKARYVCINKGQAFVPEEISAQSLTIDADIAEVLKAIRN